MNHEQVDPGEDIGRGAMASTGEAARRLWRLVDDVVLLVDGDGRIVEVSPSVEECLGHRPEELVGRPVLDLVHPDGRVGLEACLMRPDLADGGESDLMPLRDAQGSWIPSVVRMQPIAAGSDGQGLALVVRRHEDRQPQLAADERAALDRLQLVDEMKHRLMEVVSHELRTPLTIISGFAETFSREGFEMTPERLAEIGTSIQRQSSRLQQIVADLMDLDRASRGALLAERRPTDLSSRVIAVAEQVGLGSRRLNLELERVTIEVDRAKFDRIVESLLVNVRRHTPADTTVWVRLASTGDGAVLEVCDDGPGLDDELKNEVFSPFAQGSLLDPASPGLGLGLALVRRFTELHGGHCWVEDRDGGGARFVVSLPNQPQRLDLDDLNQKLTHARAHERTLEGDRHEIELRPEMLALVSSMLHTARNELDMPVAYLSAFTETEQVILAVDGDGAPLGIRPGETVALEDTYCVRMIRGEIGNLIVDTSRQPEVATLPSTDQGLACYAGVPVHLPNGQIFGSLCCADTTPRTELTSAEVSVLQAVAEIIGNQIAHRQLLAVQDRELTRRVEQLLSRPNSIRTHYQPIVDLDTGAVAGVESLSRFPDSDIRPPNLWFADAESVGMATELEQLAIHSALAGIRQLPPSCYLAINVSPGAILDGALRPLLGSIRLDRLVIEITEHAVVDSYQQLAAALRPFRNGGARVAIDDVGSGFASLRHVLRLEPDIIKMDRSLVHDVADDPAQHAVATALSTLGQRLGVKTVAEGVEDHATLDILREAGVTHAQGWLFARPAPLPLRHTSYPLTP
ncbi:MAG: EAL domain-containing protein [Nitriliruptorales bacterium]|nr:EAL domain-containing protein [Nitriliruptorales bacterium]